MVLEAAYKRRPGRLRSERFQTVDDLAQQFDKANQQASMLAHVAPHLTPHQVRTLIQHLGELFTPLVAGMLQPLLEFGPESDGQKTLRTIIGSYGPDPLGRLGIKRKSVDFKQPFATGEEVEPLILDALAGSASLERAAAAVLKQCSDPAMYVRIHAGMSVTQDLAVLPHRALPRAMVLLRVTRQLLPGDVSLLNHLTQVACQSALKLCEFSICLEEADRLLSDSGALGAAQRSVAQTFRGVALAGLGELAAAREALAEARRIAEPESEGDSSALCLALTEQFRLALDSGEWTDLILVYGRLTQVLRFCGTPTVHCIGMSYVAVGQQQLGHVEAALEIAQAARDKAHGQRFLDAELDACNRHALLLFWKGRRQEAIELLTPQLSLLSLSGNALLAAQAEALVRQSEARETWINDPPWSWPDELPMPAQLPAVPRVHILTGRARRRARVDLKEAAHVLAPAIRQCEKLRRTGPEDQRSRFLVQFRNVYSLSLDLPIFEALAPDEYLDLLRTVIALFDYDELQADRSLARALLQIHYARHGQRPSGRDKIETLLVETVLDPHNTALHLELAWCYLEQDDLYAAHAAAERSLEIEENWSAYRALGLIAFRSGLYKDAFEHFQSAAACTSPLPDEVTLEYAEMARLADQPTRAIELLAPRAAAMATPTVWALLATCYSALADLRNEGDCLVRYLAMRPSDDAFSLNAITRLREMGRLEELQSLSSDTADVQTEEKSQESTVQPARHRGGVIDDPSRHRPCNKCGRVVYDIGATIGRHALMDASVARVSGVRCGQCDGFFCVVPCSLRGTEEIIRLCPVCREFLTGVLPDVD